MAKVIYVNDNGEEKVLREGNILEWEVMFKPDYFATKMWCGDDIAMRIEEMYGREATEKEVADVINAGGSWWGLEDCSNDWYCIDDVIVGVLGKDGLL